MIMVHFSWSWWPTQLCPVITTGVYLVHPIVVVSKIIITPVDMETDIRSHIVNMMIEYQYVAKITRNYQNWLKHHKIVRKLSQN